MFMNYIHNNCKKKVFYLTVKNKNWKINSIKLLIKLMKNQIKMKFKIINGFSNNMKKLKLLLYGVKLKIQEFL